MPDTSTAEGLRQQLKRRGVHLNTLHATLRIAALDPTSKHYRKEREARIQKCIRMLGGVREPDLLAITRLSQPTLWRIVEGLRTSGAIRVVADYNDHVPGRRAKWLQPPASADLTDDRRAALVDTAALIKAYVPLWEAEQAAVQVALAPPAPTASVTRIAPAPPAATRASTANVGDVGGELVGTPVDTHGAPLPAPVAVPRPAVMQSPPVLAPLQAAPTISQPAPPQLPPLSVPPSAFPTPSPIRVIPLPLPPPPIGPPFERPDDWEPAGFPWVFTVKASLTAFLVSAAITTVLLHGVTVWRWTQAWGATLLWVIAGSTLIGLVRWKGDTWWLGELDVGHRVNRGTVLLGLTLLVLPTGLGRWSWTAFGPVPDDVPARVADPRAPTLATPLALPSALPIAPASSPTPATCGLATVAAPRGLRLRAHPGTAAAIIGTLPQRTQLELLCGTHDVGGIRWVHVRAGAGEGWVAAEERGQRYLIRP